MNETSLAAHRTGYDRVAAEYARRIYGELQHKPLDRQLLDQLVTLVWAAGPICDLGCGPGQVAAYLQGQGASVLGVDLSPGMVAVAQQLNPAITFQQGNMLALDWPDQAWGGVAAFYSLIHIPRTEVVTALREIRRVLKPGGVLLLAFHIGEQTVHLDEWWGEAVALDFNFFTPTEMADWLTVAGFDVLETHVREPYPEVEHQSQRAYLFARSPAASSSGLQAEAADYDTDPARFRINQQVVAQYGLAGDVHEEVAARFAATGRQPILDLGCGEGRLVRPARTRGLTIIALDASATMLASVSAPRVQAEATALPFADQSFAAVAALYMLYHLPEPQWAIAESYRVLQPGGLFVACAPSRYDNPELAAHLPPSPPSTFDAENGPALIHANFSEIEVERWDAPLVHLPDPAALALYLRGYGHSSAAIACALPNIVTPLTLTKRGALIIGRKA